MSQQSLELVMNSPVATEDAREERSATANRAPRKWNARAIAGTLAIPVASLLALALHYKLADHALSPVTHSYPTLLLALLAASVLAAIVQPFWPAFRSWFLQIAPLVAAATLALCAWEIITLKAALLPIMYFPPPERVIQTLLDDYRQLLDSAWHSLLLLLSGYFAGTICGLFSGITIGWSRQARYWGMPLLKIVGPIPATAWIPMALIIFPQSNLSGIALIALAVWFPVTMLTASGVSNTKASYLDCARTLGAGRWYLISRVAIPAAMPSIFIGLFMGLGASFLTLLVAESTGVRSGLGWYIDWARNYSDYTKVFAALVIMALFFSTLMTVLFKMRDRVLVWQKGVIKW